MKHPELGVKQYVAVVQSHTTGCRFMVFETGDSKFYLFQQLDENGCATAIPGFPVRKTDLRPDIRAALRHGWGNTSL